MHHLKDPLCYLDTSIIYHNTVNMFIPPERAVVQYDFNLVNKFCCETLIIKTDIEDALRIVPIYQSNHHFPGFKSLSGYRPFHV